LPVDPIPSAALEFTLQVERLFAALIHAADTSGGAEPGQSTEPSLGGKLLYAGELEPHGRALLVSANIAGAASLSASADAAARKQAIRDGVADFLVNSLDEALRILKNEIRKRETVAVCVAAAPEAFEREMLERGVLPDLLAPRSFQDSSSSHSFGPAVRRVELATAPDAQALVIWSVDTAPAQWLPKVDALAMECLQENASPTVAATRRWLRLAPRYLGRLAEKFRILRCQPDTANEFVSRVQRAVDRGEILVEVRISVNGDEGVFRIQPSREAGR
jgi:hypothetical protein